LTCNSPTWIKPWQFSPSLYPINNHDSLVSEVEYHMYVHSQNILVSHTQQGNEKFLKKKYDFQQREKYVL